jgi:serine/threonine protein kinase
MKHKEHIILQLAIRRGFVDPEILKVLHGDRTPTGGYAGEDFPPASQLEMLMQEGILSREIVEQLAREAENWPAERDTMPSRPRTLVSETPSQKNLSIGHFEIIKFLGAGGMGRVYQVFDPTRQQVLALKVLKADDPLLRKRFLREAKAQAQVEHPNICRIYETGTTDGQAYIAMQFIEGITLDQAKGLLCVREKVEIVQQAALAIHAAHLVNLIHRDIKPNNIILEPLLDGGWKPYIMDFGLAREQDADGITRSGDIMGTPQYMSPEQARGETRTLNSRTDIYSLGATLYELLTGQAPFIGENPVAVVMNLLNGDPQPVRELNPGISPHLEAVVMKCLAKEPEQRYESAMSLAADLDKFLEGAPVEAECPPRRSRRKRSAGLRWVAVALLFIAAALILTVGLLNMPSTDEPPEEPPATPPVEEQVSVAELVEAAELSLEAGRLLPPERNNAYELVMQVRQVDRQNNKAARILHHVRLASLSRIDGQIRQEHWETADEQLLNHERCFPNDPAVETRRQEIEALGQAEPLISGAELFRSEEGSQPEQSAELLKAGTVEFRKGNYAKAVDHFQAALELDPQLVDAYFYLGVCYRVMERPEAARDNLTMVLQMDSRYTMAYLHLGLLLAEAGQYSAASQYLRKVAELGGAPEFTVSRLQLVLEELDIRQRFAELTNRPVPARHERFLGGPTGVLVLTNETLQFRTKEADQSFSFPLRKLEEVEFKENQEMVFRYESRKYTIEIGLTDFFNRMRILLPDYLSAHKEGLLESLPRFPGIQPVTIS